MTLVDAMRGLVKVVQKQFKDVGEIQSLEALTEEYSAVMDELHASTNMLETVTAESDQTVSLSNKQLDAMLDEYMDEDGPDTAGGMQPVDLTPPPSPRRNPTGASSSTVAATPRLARKTGSALMQ